MTLNDSMKQSEERIQREEMRMDALRRLREKGFEFEPASHQFVTFWVIDLDHPGQDAQPVQAMKNFKTTNGWRWIDLDNDLQSGHWNALVAYVTRAGRFPVSASAGYASPYEFIQP